VIAVEGLVQRLASAVWVASKGPVDGLHGGGGDV
jgi:hypothetical protein